MVYPLVFERARVSDRRDESLVSEIDYATNLTAVGPAPDDGTSSGNTQLQLLLSLREIEAAQTHRSSLESVRCTLRVSERQFYRSRESLWNMREVLRTTLACIHRSQALIAESDRLIARAQTLDCDATSKREMTEVDHAACHEGARIEDEICAAGSN